MDQSAAARFDRDRKSDMDSMAADTAFAEISSRWMDKACRYRYMYNFSWLGRPIIQLPQDMVAMQEIIWRVKPDLIVETGIAHGGSAVFYASMLELLGGDGRVVSVDIDIREHNRVAIEGHPMFKRIDMIEGSSTDESTARKVRRAAQGRTHVLVALDSNHTHAHVRKELDLYSPLVRKDGYLVVFDTIAEFVAEDLYADRPWSHGNNPWTAIQDFLRLNRRFEVDTGIDKKLCITTSPGGYLRCIKDEE